MSRLMGLFSFASFQLDLATGRLAGPDGPVPLSPKALSVLEHLIARRGRLIRKDELLAAVWPGVFVGGGALKVCISEIRRALGDDARQPRIIETAHRRGYRFVAEVEAAPGARPPAPPTADPVRLPVRYARNGDVSIAYQVLGSGPADVVFVSGWVSHLEGCWSEPSFARFLKRLAGHARLILMDERGSGLSDRAGAPSLEQRVEDVRAVMRSAGAPRAVLIGVSDGGPACSLFAATYPEHTDALVLIGTYARRLRADDYPWAPTPEERESFCREVLLHWGGPVGIETRAPSRAADAAFRDWWASYLRMGASPAGALELTRSTAAVDVREALPRIRVPTLVLHRAGDRCQPVEEGRYVASLVPNARFVELAGDDHLPFVGDQDAVVDAIERFLALQQARADSGRVLATILCARPSGPRSGWASIDRLQALVAAETRAFKGRDLRRAGDLTFSAFDGPARAIRCARAIVEAASRAGLAPGIGLHTGEWDRLRAVGEGPVADAAARIAAQAGDGDVLVSRIVVDLVGSSGFAFDARGRLEIEPGDRTALFAVAPPS
ncbi:MAG: alpha/beta fold hydrolase [Vicinamibacteria bacterium]